MNKNEEHIINKFASDPSVRNMDDLISLATSDLMSDDGIALLAKRLAESGKILNLQADKIYGDIPSTGGPSSLSTLICPLVLAELNIYVPKLGVPGRPAGGIDVLSQIPGYRIFLDDAEITDCLETSRYCHFLVSEEYAPHDKLLFNYRSKVGAKSLVPLVIASILAKKIVAGLSLTGLDVRVSTFGNFGHNWDQAKQNSKRFINVAKLVGINAKCYLNNGNTLMQPYIGRGESLIGLTKIFNSTFSGLLKDHFFRCMDMAFNLVNTSNKEVYSIDVIYKRFEDNLTAQGASGDSFFEKASLLQKQHIYSLTASKRGFLSIDLAKVRDAIVYFQGSETKDNITFNDPCGVCFCKFNNEYIEKGEIVLTFRANTEIKEPFSVLLSQCFEIENYYQLSTEYQIID